MTFQDGHTVYYIIYLKGSDVWRRHVAFQDSQTVYYIIYIYIYIYYKVLLLLRRKVEQWRLSYYE